MSSSDTASTPHSEPAHPGAACTHAPGLSLRLFGTPQLRRGDQCLRCTGGGLRLLALLALDGPQTRLHLASLLWDGPTAHVLRHLRVTLSGLRRTLGADADVLGQEGTRLTLDVTRVEVDALHAGAGGLENFMAGYRHRGSEAWLDWAAATEQRLREQHIQALLRAARDAPPGEAAPLVARALELDEQHPDALDLWTRLRAGGPCASEETLLRGLEQMTLNLWAAQQQTSPPASPLRDTLKELHPDRRTRPRRSPEAIRWSGGDLHPYELRDRAGAEWAARQVLARQSRGQAAALALDVLANLAVDRGEYDRGLHLAEQALTLVPEPSSELAFTAASCNVLLGQHERAAAIVHSALRTMSPLDTPALLYGILARTHDARQQYRAARHWHGLALRAAQEADDPYVLPQVISLALWHLNILGEPERSAALAQEGLTHGAPNFASHLRNSLGFSHLLRRQYGEAREALAPQLHLDNAAMASTAHACTALALHRMGEAEEAHRTLEEGLALTELTPNGSVRYEWAAAALTVDPGEWHLQAQQMVEGTVPNDPTVAQWYAQLRARFDER